MFIRKTEIKDLDNVMMIYEDARSFMKENGNPNQWGDSYPERELIKRDISEGKVMSVWTAMLLQVCSISVSGRILHILRYMTETGLTTNLTVLFTE
jgi:hypothetical protein